MQKSVDMIRTAEITCLSSEAAAAQFKIEEARKDAAVAVKEAATLGVSLSTLHDFVDDQQKKAAGSILALQESQEKLDAAIQAANDAAAKAAVEADRANANAKPRRLNVAEQTELLAARSPFPGQKIIFGSVTGDSDGEQFRQDFVDIFSRAGWAFDKRTDVIRAVYQTAPIGVKVTINQNDAQIGRVSNAAAALVNALDRTGITSGHMLFVEPTVPLGERKFIVGVKPPPR